MSMLMISACFGFLSVGLALLLAFRVLIQVEPFTTVLIMRFGRVIEEISTPGPSWRLGLLVPGTSKVLVSNALEGLRIDDLHVNDRDGTTMRIDLWAECSVSDAHAALFAVESWRDSLRGVLRHALMSAAGLLRFENIVSDRSALVRDVVREVDREVQQWGIRIESLSIQDVRVLPDVTRQLFDRVAAQIDMEKARLEEEGRIAIHQLEAETESKVAELRARARSHASLAVGRAYVTLRKSPKILDSFETLHRYSMVQPGKTTAFFGFGEDELGVLDAAMLPEVRSEQSFAHSPQTH